MRLEDFQQNILNLLKDRPLSTENHTYFNELKGSQPYQLTHDAIIYWRASQLSRICVLTTRYLTAKGQLEQVILDMYREQSLSNFAEEICFFFLHKLKHSDDAVLASVAAFELAHIGRRFKREVPLVVHWVFEPTPILQALMKNDFSDECLITGKYVTNVPADPSQSFELYTEETWQALNAATIEP